MKFHPKKCKVLTVSTISYLFYRFPHELYNGIIDYITEQTDLRVTVTNRMSLKKQENQNYYERK